MTMERHWIPPAALVAAQLAQGASWLILALVAWPDRLGLSMPGLAWIHTVALGWLSMTALGVMVHVVPGFLDLEWVLEGLARWSLLPFGVGVAFLSGGFLLMAPHGIATGATLALLGLAGYLGPALWTLYRFQAPPGSRAPLKAAFVTVLSTLALTATLGWLMATALAGAPWAGLLVSLPPLHAILGGAGWLSTLIIGVSTRPIFPITGRRRVTLRWHWLVSSAFSLGTLLVLLGLLPWRGSFVLVPIGLASLTIAVTFYLWDLIPLLVAAPNPNKPPIAFISSALGYFTVAIALGWGIWAGHPEWQAALAFVSLAGWLGQSVNGYALHIGTRLLATVTRGPDDETAPGDVLPAPLCWAAFFAFQAAIAMGTIELIAGRGHWLTATGGLGLAGWILWLLSLATARRRLLKGTVPLRP